MGTRVRPLKDFAPSPTRSPSKQELDGTVCPVKSNGARQTPDYSGVGMVAECLTGVVLGRNGFPVGPEGIADPRQQHSIAVPQTCWTRTRNAMGELAVLAHIARDLAENRWC